DCLSSIEPLCISLKPYWSKNATIHEPEHVFIVIRRIPLLISPLSMGFRFGHNHRCLQDFGGHHLRLFWYQGGNNLTTRLGPCPFVNVSAGIGIWHMARRLEKNSSGNHDRFDK